jgi:hypothetical protein
MTLTEEFKSALSESYISNLEMSWTMGVTLERLHDLLKGANYLPNEELIMLRFVFKQRIKSRVIFSHVIPPESPIEKIILQDHPSQIQTE